MAAMLSNTVARKPRGLFQAKLRVGNSQARPLLRSSLVGWKTA